LHLNLLHLYNSPWCAIMHIVQIQYNTLSILKTRKQSLMLNVFKAKSCNKKSSPITCKKKNSQNARLTIHNTLPTSPLIAKSFVTFCFLQFMVSFHPFRVHQPKYVS
jgi:hypothetical protein